VRNVERLIFAGLVGVAILCPAPICVLTAQAEPIVPEHKHGFYSIACCNGSDYEPIPSSAITESTSGFVIEYQSVNGQHVNGFIKRGLEKISPDGRDHACKMPNGVRCLYRNPPSM
jgi:hypothetical protein